MELLDQVDKSASKYIHDLEFDEKFERIVYVFARLMNPDVISFIILLVYIMTSFNIEICLIILSHTVVSLIITLTMKKYLERPRPEINKSVNRLHNLRGAEKNFSMPSGDSFQAGNFCVIFSCYFNLNYFFFMVPLVMFARIYYFCHYIGDTIVGALLGILVSYTIYQTMTCYNFLN
jgi:membrane-associated phospholipid phosphatase